MGKKDKTCYRLKESDSYSGSKESIERLKYLFYITKLNIRDFINEGNAYVQYISEKLNQVNNDKKSANINNYDDVFYRVFKILEYENIGNLTRLLFNVLVSFDAFLNYISSEIPTPSHNELKSLVEILTPILNISIVDCDTTIDLRFFISEVRNTFLHNGKYIAQFSILPNDNNNKFVPGLSISLDNIFNNEYFESNNIPRDCVIDTIELFNIVYSKLNEIQNILSKIK